MRHRCLFIGPLDLKKDLSGWSGTPPNPGIGGTEFQLISLAKELAMRESELDITLLLIEGSSNLGPISGVNVVNFRTSMTFDHTTTVVCPASTARNLEVSQFNGGQLVISSHHPHDFEARKATRRLPVSFVRCVGAYSFFSLGRLKTPSIYIPNLFLSEIQSPIVRESETLTLGNVSSWHPSKGVHHVLGIFARLSSATGKTLKFELIGGHGLYDSREGSLIAQPARQREIATAKMKIFLNGSTLVSHGVASKGVAKLIRGWDVAVLNPLGIGESDPASFKDCLAQGVPVLSLGDFGMWDYQRLFPELRPKNTQSFAGHLVQVIQNGNLRRNMKLRSLILARELNERNDTVLTKWRTLIIPAPNDAPLSHYSLMSGAPAFIDRRLNRLIWFRSLLFRSQLIYKFVLFVMDRRASLIL